MSKYSFLSVVLGAALVMSCSQPVAGGNGKSSAGSGKGISVQLCAGVPGASASKGARGIAADTNVDHIDITVTNSSSTVVGTGTLTSKSASYFSGNISVSETGSLTFAAQAKSASNSVLYKGSATSVVSATGSIVTIYVTPCAGLVGEWLFSGNANDTSGNSNNGTVSSSGVSLATDRFGKANSAYSFDGSAGAVTVPDSSSLDFGTGDFSISLWFRSSTIKTYCTLLEAVDGGTGYVVSTDWDIGSRIQGVDSGLDSGISTSSTCVDGAWHHIVYVRSGPSVKLYLDNVLSGTGTSTSGTVNSFSSLLIGNSIVGDPPYTGLLDDIRIYNLALNANQVDTLYSEGGRTPD